MKTITNSFLWSLSFYFLSINFLSAQCVTGSAGGNSSLIDNMDGTYQIVCDEGDVNISSSTFDNSVIASSMVQWTSGQVGDFTFSPDCNNLGCTQFTPCIPAGTVIPQQCASFGSFGIPLSGSVPSGGSQNIIFTISDFCYVGGATYSGDLGIVLTGAGSVSLSVVQPDGAVQGPLTFDISLINSLSPIPLSLLGLNVDPNGTWNIILEDAGAGSFGYSLDAASVICIDAITTPSVECGDPIEICVIEGCPTFVSAQASQTSTCSGDVVTLDATINSIGTPNVSYLWSGNGITTANQNSAAPSFAISNNTCAVVTETYSVDIICLVDNTLIATNEQVTVTVYPEIDPNAVVIDNTTNILDPNCSIAVSYTGCPAYTITGNTVFTPGDNGTTATYTISNGNAACDYTISSTVNCIGSCTPATASVVTSACGPNNDYTIDVTISSLGNSSAIDIVASDGSVQTGITAAGGTYSLGPFASGTVVNVKLIDSLDPTCNTNLGQFTKNCSDCPNLTTVSTLVSDVCNGDVLPLVANVDQGVEGVDYSIQWFENGNPISGGNTRSYNHTAYATTRCAMSTYTYSAELTCLNSGTVSTLTSLISSPVNVFPIPEEGIDFVFENCVATPLDNCGNLVINVGGATDPAPGASATINYTISVPGAPASCQATGTKMITCPSCPDNPGNGTSTEQVVCWGESFDISNDNALVASLGYEVGYAITPNPASSYPSTTALIAASINGANGAFPAPGSISAQTYTNDGSLFTPTAACGELLYFTPFLSFACQSYTAENSSGTIETTNADGLDVPGVSGTNLSVPQVPFCTGLVTYDIQVCVEDQNTDGEEPLAEDILFGLIDGLPGGIFSVFPNIDDIHDSGGSPSCYSQNGWTQNPSGELISITTVNLVTLPFTSDTDQLDWDFMVDVNCNSTFPTVCQDCDVLGASVAVRFMPQETLPNITPVSPLCSGDVIDLSALNPTPTLGTAGSFTWYEGASANNVPVANPTTVTPPIGISVYCAKYSYCQTGDCVIEKCVTIPVNPLPTVTAPVLPQLCRGSSFDLTTTEPGIATGGTFKWYLGGTADSGGALLGDASNVIPIGSEMYCAEFTSTTTGCSSTVCSSFMFEDAPILLTVAPEICTGDDLELTDYNTSITTSAGTFVWYNGNPTQGGTALASTLFVNYDPAISGSVFYVEFTDAVSNCSAIGIVTVSQISCCSDYLYISNSYLPTDILIERANILISSEAIVPAGANITNISNQIQLDPGFEVKLGADYHGFIGNCNTP